MPVLVSLLIALPLFTPPLAAAPPTPASAAQGFDALVRQADQARDADHLDQALDLYQKAVLLKPDWEQGWWAIGTITYDQDKFSDCAAAFRRFRTLKPALAPGWTMSGLCEYGLRQYDAAYASLLQAELRGFQGPPELARAGRLHLALLLNKDSSFEHALMLCGLLFRLGDPPPETLAAAGIAGLGRPLLPTEVPSADQPLVIALGTALAAAYTRPFSEAAEKFQSALQAYPNVADIHYRFGAYLLKNQPDRGLAEIKRALELNPAHLPALVTLSLEALNAGDYESARRYAQRAVRIAPNNFASHLMLGRAFLLEIKSHDLEASPGKAASQEESSPSAQPHPSPNPLQSALRELETAVKLAPDSQDAHFSLSAAYALAGRTNDAARERAEYQRLQKLTTARTGL